MKSILNSFSKLKVLVIGDVMIDSYLWGKIERISPEAPVPIVTLQKKENRLGGAANVALNIQSLGAEPLLCSVIGNDTEGKLLLELSKQQKISSKGIIKSNKRITTVKNRIISKNQHIIRIDSEDDKPLDKLEKDRLLKSIFDLMKNVNVIIFQDYDKGILSKDVIEIVSKEANKRSIPIAVDPKKKNFLSYKNITLFKPNLKELQDGLKLDINNNNIKELKYAADKLIKELSIKTVMITLSDKGIFVCQNGEYEIIPTQRRNIIDVSGAGDTVISIAALGLAINLPLKDIARLANVAAGYVCEKVGVVPVDKNALLGISS